MKKLIFILVISALLVLPSCSSPEEETVTASSDHARISSEETKENKQESESARETSKDGSGPSEKPEHPGLPGGLKAVVAKESAESMEPSGEDYMPYSEDQAFSGGETYSPPAAVQTPQQQVTVAESSAPASTQAQPQSTACRHGSVYISGAYPATCISSGYSGDTICALCGALLEQGYATGYADHSWIEETIHEDAYLTCYCGLIFYSADDHDRHVNEMVAAGEPAGDHGSVWTPGRDYTVYTCSVCGEKLNN